MNLIKLRQQQVSIWYFIVAFRDPGDAKLLFAPRNASLSYSGFKALLATWRDGEAVTLDDFTRGVERIVAGLEKKNRLPNPREREVVAHHEMGHALVALLLPGTDPLRKVSIIPRGIGTPAMPSRGRTAAERAARTAGAGYSLAAVKRDARRCFVLAVASPHRARMCYSSTVAAI